MDLDEMEFIGREGEPVIVRSVRGGTEWKVWIEKVSEGMVTLRHVKNPLGLVGDGRFKMRVSDLEVLKTCYLVPISLLTEEGEELEKEIHQIYASSLIEAEEEACKKYGGINPGRLVVWDILNYYGEVIPRKKIK